MTVRYETLLENDERGAPTKAPRSSSFIPFGQERNLREDRSTPATPGATHMSAEAVGAVYRHSPYKGATFNVQLAVADSVNDMGDYEVWARQSWIADKARIARETTNRAIAELVADGALILLEDNARSGKPNRYKFVLPITPPVTVDHTPGVTTGHTEPKNSTQENPPVAGGDGTDPEVGMRRDGVPLVASEIKRDNYPKSFQDCWTAYKESRRGGKGDAYRAWRASVIRLKESGLSTGQALDQILTATHRYMESIRDRDPNMVKLAATFWGPGRHVEAMLEATVDTEAFHPAVPSWMRQRLEG